MDIKIAADAAAVASFWSFGFKHILAFIAEKPKEAERSVKYTSSSIDEIFLNGFQM